MNELATADFKQLPDSIEDLASWDKFLSARLPTYRKLLHNVKSWEEATEEEHELIQAIRDMYEEQRKAK